MWLDLLHKHGLVKNDTLVVNAIYLFGVLFSGSFLGSVTWILAARLYSPESVGLAASLISATQLLSGIASLGIGMGIVRFLPIACNTDEMLGSAVVLIIISSAITGIVFWAGMPLWTPAMMASIAGNWITILIAIGLIVVNSIFSLLQMVFQSTRKSKFAFWQTILANSFRLVLTIVFVSLNSEGITLAVLIPMLLMSIVSWYQFIPKSLPGFHFRFALSRKAVFQLVPYSIGLHVAGQIAQAPILLSPLFVLEKLGPQLSASTYIALMIGSFIISPGQAMAASAFAEGSNVVENLRIIINKANKISLAITVGFAIFILIAAPFILGILGKQYQIETKNLIIWFVLSSPFAALSKNGFTVMQVQDKIRKLIGISAISVIVFFTISYLTIDFWGLTAIGLAWFVSQAILFFCCLSEIFPKFGHYVRT